MKEFRQLGMCICFCKKTDMSSLDIGTLGKESAFWSSNWKWGSCYKQAGTRYSQRSWISQSPGGQKSGALNIEKRRVIVKKEEWEE